MQERIERPILFSTDMVKGRNQRSAELKEKEVSHA